MTTKSGRSIFMLFTLAIGLLFFLQDAAEAARLGKRRSFGSKPSYQQSAKPPAKQATAQQADPKAAAGQTNRGRWGGMLGGMLMGGLIGSLLFGGGFGGGAGMLDLLLIGGGLFLLFRFLKARRMAAQTGGGGAFSFDGGSAGPWGASTPPPPPGDAAAGDPAGGLPPGFDPAEFLKGAGAIYTRLQTAWDQRDLEDIRAFTAPEVFAEIQRQAEEDPTPSKTEILMVTPSIIEARQVGRQIIVSVLYDVMMREDGEMLSKQVRELWHFSREQDNPDDFWRLEGIQQIEG